MKKLFLSFALIASLSLMAASTVHASGIQTLKVENKDGVMYVSTAADSQTKTSTLSAQAQQAQEGNAVRAARIDPGTGYADNVGNVINFALRVVMVVAVLLVFFYLIMAGVQWITSGGEKSKTEAARNKITAAIIGLVILAASYAILLLLIRYLGFSDLPSVINNVGTINSPGNPTDFATPSPVATSSSLLHDLTR
jgi:hypothetical protein